jgi:hypothetical protein
VVYVPNNKYWVQSFERLSFVIIIRLFFCKCLYDKHIPSALSTDCALIQILTFLWHGSMHCFVMTVLIIHILISRYICIKAFSFLWDQFHIVDIPLLVISHFLAEYILQSIEKFRKAWGQPDFCRQNKINNDIFGLENDNCESTQLLGRVSGPGDRGGTVVKVLCYKCYVVKDDFLNSNKGKVVYWMMNFQGDSSLTP